ncbi:MAG: Slp family lipoprotein [Smithella sp.]
MIWKVLIVCLAGIISACAPVISQKTMDIADKSISFSALQENPDNFKGKTVILGGQIITTTVKENETWIEVLQKPLDSRQKPLNTDKSLGRFLARFRGFLDPSIYASGRKLTVAGIVEGKIIKPLKELNYTYPVLFVQEYYLWKPDDAYIAPRFGVGIGVGTGSYGGGMGMGF